MAVVARWLLGVAGLALGCGGEGGGSGAGGGAGTAPTAPELLPEHWRDGLAAGVGLGLAQEYPRDVGITDHPDVLVAEDFEFGTVTIPTEEDRYATYVTVTDEVAYTGSYAGVHRWNTGDNLVTTRFLLGPAAHDGERPAYFMRMCFNFGASSTASSPISSTGRSGTGRSGTRTTACAAPTRRPSRCGRTGTPSSVAMQRRSTTAGRG